MPRGFVGGACLGVFMFCTSPAQGAGYQFWPLTVPGTAWSIPIKINDNNVIVGYAQWPDGKQGFVYDVMRNKAIEIKGPASCYTELTGINNRGEIVGSY